MQDRINKKPAIFEAKIIKELNIPPKSITWLSPLKSDQYAEYRRKVCKVDAYLIFLYFLNDHTHKPTTREQWADALDLQKRLMDLKSRKLQKFIADVFIDVNEP